MQPISRLIIASSITSFLGNQDFLQTYMWQKNFSWINNRPIVKKTIDLLFSKKINLEGRKSCYSNPSLRNPWTHAKQGWCFERFAIHYDLIYEPFSPQLLSAVCLEACSKTGWWTVVLKYPEESLIGHCKDNITQGFLLVPLLWYQKYVIDKSLILT